MPPIRALALAVVLAAAPLLAGGDAAALDVPMLPPGPMPMVDVMVNGKGPFQFVVDTGAHPSLTLDAALVEKLALPDGGAVSERDHGDGDMPHGRRVRAASVAVGGLVVENVDAVAMSLPRSPRAPRLDGVLGLGFFGERVVTLDFPGRRVRAAAGALPAPDGADVLPMRREMGLPAIDLVVGDQKVSAHLDTGNMAGAFMFPAELVDRFPRASEPVVVGRARSIFGETEVKSVRLKPTLRIGRHEFPEPTVVYPNVMDIANVGSRALADFVLTIDAKNARLRLERRAPVTTASGTPGRTNDTMEVTR